MLGWKENIGQEEGKPYFIFRLLYFIFMLCSIPALFPLSGGKGKREQTQKIQGASQPGKNESTMNNSFHQLKIFLTLVWKMPSLKLTSQHCSKQRGQ